ncbi:hypothetical protein EYF80_021899 [Liparis tanakae]|uniref:Uncharacterized protein n=1 Tax=Liparis tanakae TaxID=230148 RepID=A0A4Z2HQL7_9TELE|nr:hypothetical protein EYF80_021899 [Liparis tanakae]
MHPASNTPGPHLSSPAKPPRGGEAPLCGQRQTPGPSDERCSRTPAALIPARGAAAAAAGPVVVYLFVDADGEDIPVPQRLLAQHQPVVELLDWLVAPGGSVRVGQADQLSAPRMQLRRHLQWAANIHDSRGVLRQLLTLWQLGHSSSASTSQGTLRLSQLPLRTQPSMIPPRASRSSPERTITVSLDCMPTTILLEPSTSRITKGSWLLTSSWPGLPLRSLLGPSWSACSTLP